MAKRIVVPKLARNQAGDRHPMGLAGCKADAKNAAMPMRPAAKTRMTKGGR